MFLTLSAVAIAMQELQGVHPFFGISYLVFKRNRTPVGYAAPLPINKLEEEFLDEFFKPDPRSEHYYQIFRPRRVPQPWLSHRYPSTGLQSIRTRGRFFEPFIHPRGSDGWGWRTDYVKILTQLLAENPAGKIPAFSLAVWLFRYHDWPLGTTPRRLLRHFLDEFYISKEEQEALFNVDVPRGVAGMFGSAPIEWADMQSITGKPPDAVPDEGGTLSLLTLDGIGPADHMSLEPAARLNLVTGDNGLGKTFLLDCAWWALTGVWASLPAFPRSPSKTKPRIQFDIEAPGAKPHKAKISYDWDAHQWPIPRNRPTIPGLIIYARVDGSFAVWDPIGTASAKGGFQREHSVVLTREQVWSGSEGVIEGLLRDWVTWQRDPTSHPFDSFSAVLTRLSPSDLGPLKPGAPVRLPGYRYEIPTIEHSYGIVPIILASAGVRRIVTLAYLIVWAWNEHKIASDFRKRKPQSQMVILIDEMEAHLHPRWQRAVLPALLRVREDLSRELQAQVFVATHSPLVMASIEGLFDEETDKLFHLGFLKDGSVRLDELPYIPQGPADAWLTSPVFDLRQPRSQPGETAIENAKQLQRERHVSEGDVRRVSDELLRHLPPEDPFWARWILFASEHGIDL